jgi:uncharacterized iron-regulated protein
MKGYLSCLWLCIFVFAFSIYPDVAGYTIIDSSSKKTMTREELVKLCEGYDVIIIGEEHNDTQGHKEKLSFLQELHKNYPVLVSMEMLESDNQLALNEYLAGLIQEKQFIPSVRLWNNYTNDYRPIVEWAKENEVPVVASNAPDRYVKMVSYQGLSSLKKLSEEALQFLPPLYSVLQYSQKTYEEKFDSFMGGHSHPSASQNFLMAQYLRDASMAHHILRSFHKTGKKVVHINGRFHSDHFLGVTYRIASSGVKTLSISMFPLKTEVSIDQFTSLANIVYITKVSSQKSKGE